MNVCDDQMSKTAGFIVYKYTHSPLYLNCGITVAWQSLIAMSRLYKITAINLIENVKALQTEAL